MSFHLVVTRKTDADIGDSIAWYNDKQYGLGFRFLECILDQLDKIVLNSFGYAVRFKNVRCAVVHQFPYLIYSFVHHSQITVIGVLHAKRNPNEFKKRTN